MAAHSERIKINFRFAAWGATPGLNKNSLKQKPMSGSIAVGRNLVASIPLVYKLVANGTI